MKTPLFFLRRVSVGGVMQRGEREKKEHPSFLPLRHLSKQTFFILPFPRKKMHIKTGGTGFFLLCPLCDKRYHHSSRKQKHTFEETSIKLKDAVRAHRWRLGRPRVRACAAGLRLPLRRRAGVRRAVLRHGPWGGGGGPVGERQGVAQRGVVRWELVAGAKIVLYKKHNP